VLLLLAGACRCGKTPASAEADEAVKPVYAGAVTAPDPAARSLCQALHGLPEERRASCCGGAPRRVLADECTRMLSLALQSGALALDAERTSRCIAAIERTLQGCDWVGPAGAPLPEPCLALAVGHRERGGRCRSALECQKGLRCQGLGPTQPGVCDAPGAPTTACELGVDALATYLRQDAREHPECSGTCVRRTCVPASAVGGACSAAVRCGPDAHCAGGRCAPGRFALAGEACLPGACQPDAVCTEGICAQRKVRGKPCRQDQECLGACLRPDGGTGVCGPRC
jgi:hypothetical protein